MSRYSGTREIPRFDRNFLGSREKFTRIGGGSLGGKAEGLVFISEFLGRSPELAALPGVVVAIPTLTVIATEPFDAFMQENDLRGVALSGEDDARIAHAFQRAALPAALVGDLRALIAQVHAPLAVRSSSLLEDALEAPFAGVYATKMIPNNQLDPDVRFRRLVEAVKFVYASAFFKEAVDYRRAAGREADEKMAVIVQEVVGTRHTDRFYPDLSGVARSYNFYPAGGARPEEGVVQLALGLGKTIVDGGRSWTYSPAWPKAPPPSDSAAALLDQTQVDFWAVNMGPPPEYDPIAETEYLVRPGLAEAEEDGTLRRLASTYSADSDSLSPGTARPGPRVLNFAPLLVHEEWPLNDLIRRLLSVSEEALGAKVEIEFAVTLPQDPGGPARFGFLQVRPMAVLWQTVAIDDQEMTGPDALLASTRVMGNGVIDTVRDIVYVKPDAFEAARTRDIAAEIDAANRALTAAGRPYLLIGFGRWGSQDPWLGIPVAWGQIGGAKAIVEAALPGLAVEPSQGSHFFHNITSFGVGYFTAPLEAGRGVDWAWLAAQPASIESRFVRCVALESPLNIRMDGRRGRGVILRPAGAR